MAYVCALSEHSRNVSVKQKDGTGSRKKNKPPLSTYSKVGTVKENTIGRTS